MNLKLVSHELWKTINRNSPSILTGFGIAGFVTSIVMAVRATPKALAYLDEAEYQELAYAKEVGLEYVWTVKEQVIHGYKFYIPTIGMALLSATSIIMANRINLRRNAALASLYAIAQNGLQEYQTKVVESIGEKKEQLVRGEVAQQKLNNHPIDEGQIVMTDGGDMLCYESLSGRYFKSDIETLRQIQNDFNARLLVEMTLTLNELFSDMGLGNIELGDKIGWTVEKGLLEFDFNAKIATNGQPCIVVDQGRAPEALWF